MSRPITAAALCAALLSFLPPARAQEIPEPESHTVLEPPAAEAPPAAEPADISPSPAKDRAGERGPGGGARSAGTAEPERAAPPGTAPIPSGPRSELGFQIRAGAADVDRFTFGGSITGGSGPITFGLSGDMTADTRGSGRRYQHDHDGRSGWCEVRSDGRCLNQADFALSGFAGLRTRTGPFLGATRLRLEVVGEAGWQLSWVEERLQDSTGTYWSDGSRAYPFAGVRGGVGLTFLRSGYFGVGAFARRSLAGRVCVTTDGGCTRAGGPSEGVFLFAGGEWGMAN